MRRTARVFPLAALLAVGRIAAAKAQAPPSTPTPAPAPASAITPAPLARPVEPAATETLALPLPTPIAPTTLRIRETPVIAVEKLPASNPFGSIADVPAALPTKLAFTDAILPASFFLSVHVDPAGKVLSVRRDRDPIPSLAAETMKSISRWPFAPALRAGQPVGTWGVFRLDLSIEIRSPKVTQSSLTPVTPETPLPRPFQWPPDAEWLESRRAAAAPDGSVPIEQVDTVPMPQKTPWSADSYKGPFSVKYWVKVGKTGRIDRAIPLEVSDPVLLPYFRKAMSAWAIRPAQAGGAPVDSWNELLLSGQVSYSDEIKQIGTLRKSIG